MDRAISDQAQVETSGRVLDLLRTYVTGNWNSETHQQHQNHVEGKYRIIKRPTNCIIERKVWITIILLASCNIICTFHNKSYSNS